MCLELTLYSVTQMTEKHSQPLATGELKCRDKIAVTRYGNNRLSGPRKSQSGDVQPDAKVYSLLFNIRDEILRIN